MPFSRPDIGVGLGAQLDPGHILEPHEGPVRVGPQHDLRELLGRLQPALGPDGIGELLAGGRGLAADLPGRVDRVLLLMASTISGIGDVELGQLVRLHPAAHGVLAGAENGDAGDPRDPGELVVQVDVGIVGQEGRVVGARRAKRGATTMSGEDVDFLTVTP